MLGRASIFVFVRWLSSLSALISSQTVGVRSAWGVFTAHGATLHYEQCHMLLSKHRHNTTHDTWLCDVTNTVTPHWAEPSTSRNWKWRDRGVRGFSLRGLKSIIQDYQIRNLGILFKYRKYSLKCVLLKNLFFRNAKWWNISQKWDL